MIDFAILAACILTFIGINVIFAAIRGGRRLREEQQKAVPGGR